jgi:predicted metal-dependent hydrolase
MNFDWTEGSLAEGLRLYEAGEFFTAHEAWESVWLRLPEPEKTFLQGLIQVTAAFHHLQRDNPLGTLLLLQAALRRLERYPEEFGGISVKLLCHDIRDRVRTLEAGEPASQLASPRIRPSSHFRGTLAREQETPTGEG